MIFFAPWRSPLSHALHRNRSLPSARYLQLATVGLDGRPRNRTVVFRQFREGTNQLQIVTDSRSDKYQQIQEKTSAEICWYFPKTREQFRLSGELILVTAQTTDSSLIKARSHCWQHLSDSGRIQFAWPDPKLPLDKNKDAFKPPLPSPDVPLTNFCLVLLEPITVDHLELRGDPQNRYLYTLEPSQSWSCQQVNP